VSDTSSLLLNHRTSHVRETHYVGNDAPLNAAVEFVFQKLKEGCAVYVIKQYLALDFPHVREDRYAELLEVAYNYGAAALHKDRDFVFYLHAERYELIYQRALILERDHQPVPLDPVRDRLKVIQKLRTAAKSLRQKEELLGLHDKRVVLEVTDSEVFLLDQGEDKPKGAHLFPRQIAGGHLENLTVAELGELLRYLQEVRTTPLEGVQRVRVRQVATEVVDGGVLRYETEREVTPVAVDAAWAADLPAPVLDQVTPEERPIGERVDLSGVRDLRSQPVPPGRTLEELQELQETARRKKQVKSRALDKLRALSQK